MEVRFWQRALRRERVEFHWSDGEMSVHVYGPIDQTMDLMDQLRDQRPDGPALPDQRQPLYGRRPRSKPHPDQLTLED